MDYKFKQTAVLIASIMVLIVLIGVLIANKSTIKRRAAGGNTPTATVVADRSETASVNPAASDTFFGGKMVGNDLAAWKNDPLFFGDKNEHISDGPIRIDVSASDISGSDVSGSDVSGSDVSGSNGALPGTPADIPPGKDEDPLNNGAG